MSTGGLTIEPGLLGLLVAPTWAGACLALAAVLAFTVRTPIKLALVPAMPLVAVELWNDVRSRSRRLAAALWLILAARIVASVCHVRTQIAQLHGRPANPPINLIADGAALAIAAVLMERSLWPALVYVIVLIGFQATRRHRPLWPVAIIGARQAFLGLGLVVVTAVAA
ncbi:MAG: hypothetical protein HRT86_01805 [Ilumatobacteraceae bacterium]|nr:hypothetical protein [Ilumatobacteraceae bacterium]